MTLIQQPATPQSPSRKPRLVPIGRPRITGVRVLWTLVLLFFSLPFIERFDSGQYLESALLTLVICFAVLAVGADRRALIISIALAAPAILGKWASHIFPQHVDPAIYLASSSLCVGYVTFLFLRFIVKARTVDTNVLCAGVASFLMLALLWSFLYMLLEQWSPGSFVCTVAGSPPSFRLHGFTALYFSTITLCTVGYGDIVPTGAPARMLAMMEGMAGVFYIAVMVSRLVSLYAVTRSDNQAPDPAPPHQP